MRSILKSLLLVIGVFLATSLPCVAQFETEFKTDRQPAKRRTGREFRDALRAQITMKTARQPVNRVLRALADNQQVAILLDRRIDRRRLIKRDVDQLTLAAAISQIAGDVDGVSRTIGDVVFVGPRIPTEKLLSLIAKIDETASSMPREKRSAFAKSKETHWSDLAEPRQIAASIVDQYFRRGADLNAELDKIPHDLWQWNTLPKVNLVEGLSLILIQFNLTFEFVAEERIRVVPVPDDVTTTRSYPIGSRTSAKEIIVESDQRFGPGRVIIAGSEVRFRGTVEQHEEFKWISRGRKPPKPAVIKPKPSNLESVRFDLPAQTVSAAKFIEGLRSGKLEIQVDEAGLKAAGIDLQKQIRFEFKKASVREICKYLCEQVGAEFTIEGSLIRIHAP